MDTHEYDWSALEPVADARVTAGQPKTRIAGVERNPRYACGVWEATEGCFTTAKDGDEEVIYIRSGRGWLRSTDGRVIELRPGVMFVMEDGFRGEWDIEETIQKTYVQIMTAPTTA